MTRCGDLSNNAFWGDTDEAEALERYRALATVVDDGLYRLDSGGCFVAVTDELVDLVGYSREDLLGAHVSLVIDDADIERFERDIRDRLEQGETDETFDVSIETASGTAVRCELRYSLLVVDGEFRGTMGTVRAVANRTLPDSMRESYESISSVLDEADVGVIVLDDEFDVAWINEATERYFEIDRADVVGRDKRELIDETIRDRIADSETFTETVRATYDDNSGVERFQCQITASDDRKARWLEHRSKPIESGQYAGGRVELYYDVTEQRRRTTQLRRLNEAVGEWLEGTSRESVAERACHHLADIVGLELNGIFLFDSTAQELQPVAWTESAETLFDELPTFAENEGIAWRVFESGQLEVYDDVRSVSDILNPETPIRSEIVLPIGDHGVVLIGSEQHGTFDDGDLTLAKIAASSLEATFDRIRHEHRVERERAQTEKLLQTAPVAIAVENAAGETVLANRRARDAIGVAEDEIDQRLADADVDVTLFDAGGDPIDPDKTPIARVRETGTPVFDEEVAIEHPTGERRWFSVNAAPVFGPDGTLERIITVGEDVTELKVRERELESELSEIFGRVSDAFYALDEEFRFTHVNERAEDLLQQTEAELLGEELWTVFPAAADESMVRESISRAMETQDATEYEYHVESLDFWIEGMVYPSETGVSVYFRDVTERKVRERELELYERIVETVDDGVYAVDQDARFVLINEALCEMVGWEREDLLGKHATTVYDDELASTAAAEAAAVSAGEQEVAVLELELHTKDGGTVPVETRFGPFTYEDGSTGRAGVVRDITERQEYQHKLEESNERLEQFAYAASHDLQEPLRMVTSYLQLIERRYSGALDDSGQEFIEFAVDGAQRMREMIEGLLEYSRVESQGDPFEPVELDAVLEDVCEDLQLQIQAQHATLDIESVPCVRGDESQLRQLFQNLLDNALEYSGDDPPEIRVSAERAGSMWVVDVQDDGIGIDPAETDRLFEVFQRLHTYEEHEGTGIGLALCRRIAERHGGAISVTSEPGEGATFSVSLPATEERPDSS